MEGCSGSLDAVPSLSSLPDPRMAVSLGYVPATELPQAAVELSK